MLKDSAPEKWEYREHTQVKHILLEKYLSAWLRVLGRWNPKICYVDGFAGRGKYTDGTLGSPIKALKVAGQRAQNFDKLICIFIEKDKDNFENLEKVLKREKPNICNWGKIEIIKRNNEFASVIREILDYLEEKKSILIPSFFFIDPFGFSGIPFEIICRILSNPQTEVFFTCMVRDIGRFIANPLLKDTLTEQFGTDEWKKIIDLSDREKAMIELYRKQLHDMAGVRYSLHFRMCESERLRTLYYLIHAANNSKGHKIMKQIMFKQSPYFAYLGPKDVYEQTQIKLFDVHDIEQLKSYLTERFQGETLTYDEIQERVCEPWYSEPPYIDKHYRDALKELEKEDKIRVNRITSKTIRGLGGNDIIIFPKSNPIQESLPISIPKAIRKIKVYYKEYQSLEEKKETQVHRVNDGSIIKRFDKTPPPQKETDIVCPHFLELKWAYGCPYDCAWCYLKGTFRFRPEGTSPAIKDYDKIKLHTKAFLEEVKTPEILNTGEIADSLMNEHANVPFSKFIIPMFEAQRVHKVLFLTKSSHVKNLLEMKSHNQVIMSFSLNAVPVAKRWEKAPSVSKRIEAAKKLFDAGYEVRIRIDPMVPIDNWKEHYYRLLDIVFDNLTPERITLGSLRGLQSTINGCTDKSWVKYLKESSNWGKKIDYQTRLSMYSTIIRQLRKKHNFDKIALCKETVHMWHALKMDYKTIRCNCIW